MAARKTAAKVTPPEGQLRQSQLVTTFGPGSMVDLVNRAVVIGGLEHWGYGKKGYVQLDDARLRRALVPRLKALDPELDLAREGYFRMPPEGDSADPYKGVGIKALEFPRWFVCLGCRRLARAADQFENHKGRYRHECERNKHAYAVPVRFVASCKRGHLADFPWARFAHSRTKTGEQCDVPTLYLHEKSLGDAAGIFVECRGCGTRDEPTQVAMSHAASVPYRCSGDRPWLGGRAANEDCTEKAELLVRTASHAYFSQVVSALRLPPPEPSPIEQRLSHQGLWNAVRKVETRAKLELLMELQDKVALGLAGLDLDQVVRAIAEKRTADLNTVERPLRSVEYERFVDAPIEQEGVLPERDAEFAAYRVPKERLDLPKGVAGLVVVPVMREVRVQVSFSRFDSISANLQGEYDFAARNVKPAVLTLPAGSQKWLPACEVRGEGIFVQLDEAALVAWESRPAVQARAEKLRRGMEAEGQGDFHGVRFYMLHSLSHLLLTAISLECGYSASSIRERLYAGQAEPNGPHLAGILLSTGTTGSEGTLGGLVEEGRRIRHHLREAWELGRLCSNDPVCAAHDPSAQSGDRHTEGAACHGCLYIAESSCERYNRFLDRALVVPTIGNDPELAFFRERP